MGPGGRPIDFGSRASASVTPQRFISAQNAAPGTALVDGSSAVVPRRPGLELRIPTIALSTSIERGAPSSERSQPAIFDHPSRVMVSFT